MLLRGAGVVTLLTRFLSFFFSDIPLDYGSYGLLFRMILQTSMLVLFSDIPFDYGSYGILFRMILQTSALVHCSCKDWGRQSRFAPPSQRKVSAGKIHCRSRDWEEAKQICSSVTKKS